MQISTTARHCEVDPETRTFAHQRLEKITRFARDIREAHLTITAEKFRHVAEVTVRLDHREIVSREESPQMRTAIDRAVDRLEEQLRRYKDRRADHKREERNGAPGPADIAAAAVDDEDDEE